MTPEQYLQENGFGFLPRVTLTELIAKLDAFRRTVPAEEVEKAFQCGVGMGRAHPDDHWEAIYRVSHTKRVVEGKEV